MRTDYLFVIVITEILALQTGEYAHEPSLT